MHLLEGEIIMEGKKFVCFVLLASVTSLCHADGFFVNTSLGASNYYPSYPYNPAFVLHHSHTEALRFGYRWTSGRFSYGLETGYTNLGQSNQYFPSNFRWAQYRERVDGFTLGPSLKYTLPMGFYVSAHGGGFWSTDHQVNKVVYNPPPFIETMYSRDTYSNSSVGSYWGAGLGYDINQSFGLGVSYDRYRVHSFGNSGPFGTTPRIDAYTLTAEYRF